MKQAFSINIAQPVLDDLNYRLKQTRWPPQLKDTGWGYGTNMEYLQELCLHWRDKFNWRKNEQRLNEHAQFKASVDGFGIHFIHVKGRGTNAVPLLLVHGWPDSFVRFLKLIPLLTAVDKTGLSFDLVIPSIPGYGFSDIPTQPGMNPERVAHLFTRLMTEELGYNKYFAHGGDWGSTVVEQMAFYHPENLLGVHLMDIPFHHIFSIRPEDLSEPEKKYLAAGKKWQAAEGGYAMIQSTKPETLAYGLNDSPVGMAAWIVEKFYGWSDCDGNIENCFTKDELLTNISIYWATQTINSANRMYYESARNPPKNSGKKIDVVTGVAIFPKDLVNAPQEFAKRFYNVQHWSEMDRGGHFAAMEQPELLAADIRKFAIG